MKYGAQDVGVALIAVAALGWLVWRRVRVRRGVAAPTCPDCPVAAPTPGVRPAPMPKVRPTEAGAEFLARRRAGKLIQIQRPGDSGRR
jgi:hypothetical protein